MQIRKRLSFRSESDNGLKLLKGGKRAAPSHLRVSSTRAPADDEAEPLAEISPFSRESNYLYVIKRGIARDSTCNGIVVLTWRY